MTTRTPATTHEAAMISDCVTLLLSYHLARVEGRSMMAAVAHTARVIRDRTKDPKMAALMRSYISPLQSQTVGGRRMTGAQMKVMSLNNLQADMYRKGFINSQGAA